MKYIYVLLIATTFFSLSSCDDDYGTREIDITYDTLPFEYIRLETSSDIRIFQAAYFQVTVTGEERDVNDTHVFVDQGQLIIEEHGHTHGTQIIRIYVPEFSQLESLGSSYVYGESQFHQNESMDIFLDGSGDIDMYVDVDNLDILVSGSGSMFLEGFVDNADFSITGSGWIKAFNLNTDFCDARIAGSGSTEVLVDDDLDVVINGSGDVLYKGHPIISSQISGSGRLIDAN